MVKWTPEALEKVVKLRNDGLPFTKILEVLHKDYNLPCSLNALEHKAKSLRADGRITFSGPATDWATKKTDRDGLNAQEEKILGWLKEKPLSIGELSRGIDRSKETVIKILDSLKNKGYDVKIGGILNRRPLKKNPLQKPHPR